MIKTDEQFRINKENRNMSIQQHKKTQEAGKESWRQKNPQPNGRGDIWKKWEKTLDSLNTDTEDPRLLPVCEYPVSVQPLTKQVSHAAVSTAPSPAARPDRLPATGASVCLSVCHLPEDRKLVQASDLTCQCSTYCSPVQDLSAAGQTQVETCSFRMGMRQKRCLRTSERLRVGLQKPVSTCSCWAGEISWSLWLDLPTEQIKSWTKGLCNFKAQPSMSLIMV